MAAQPRPWLPSEAEGGPARRAGGMEAQASASLEEEEEGVPPEPSMRRTRSRLDTRTKCANCQSIAAAELNCAALISLRVPALHVLGCPAPRHLRHTVTRVATPSSPP